MRVVVVSVGFFDLAFQAVDRQVHPAQHGSLGHLLLTMNGQFGGRVLFVLADKASTLDEHAAGAAGRIGNAAVVRLEHFDEKFDNARRRVKLAAFRACRSGELAEEIFIDSAEGIVIQTGWISETRFNSSLSRVLSKI